MDEQVLRSLIKWPDVPACFGWLALDRRGQWRMRDEYAQQNQLPGQTIQHAALKEFIARNYASNASGNFFFQNGPQRVFVTLLATPWIARLIPGEQGLEFHTQCQTTLSPTGALCDEHGNIYIVGFISQTIYSEAGVNDFEKKNLESVALLHDHDLDLFAGLSQIREEACSFGGAWRWNDKELPLDPISQEELTSRFGFIQEPNPNTI
jgi:Protein of unknown function (DUF2946)